MCLPESGGSDQTATVREHFVSAYGVRVRICVAGDEMAQRLFDHLPLGCRPAEPGPTDRSYRVVVQQPAPQTDTQAGCGCDICDVSYRLYADGELLSESSKLESLLLAFESDIELLIALEARDRVFVHAGVVGWQGRAIVIPGRSFSGKTTLVAALIRAGADYYSDECAVFDPHGRVHPYPRQLFIREQDGSRHNYRPEELGAPGTGTEPLPVGLIVVTNYRPEAVWRPRLLSPGEAALALLANTACARTRPGFALKTFRQVTRRALTLKGERGGADCLAQQLLSTKSATQFVQRLETVET